jgi:hypothetical protein
VTTTATKARKASRKKSPVGARKPARRKANVGQSNQALFNKVLDEVIREYSSTLRKLT